jgi:hypothetical protein
VLTLTQRQVGYPISRPRQFLVPIRYTGPGWIKARGIVGHCHAANNSHTDPGRIKAGKLHPVHEGRSAGTQAAMRVALVPVRLGDGLVVMHTREEYERLMRGVDVPAAHAMSAPITTEEEL